MISRMSCLDLMDVVLGKLFTSYIVPTGSSPQLVLVAMLLEMSGWIRKLNATL